MRINGSWYLSTDLEPLLGKNDVSHCPIIQCACTEHAVGQKL